MFTYLNPNFGTLRTQSLILQQVAVVGALAVGQTLIILTAGIDLSVRRDRHPGDALQRQAQR